MTSLAVINAANIAGPALTKCVALATTTASQNTDLASGTNLGARAGDGSIIGVQADGTAVYVAFYKDATGTIDETSTTKTTVPIKIAADETKYFRIGNGWTFLYYKAASGTPKLRVWASSFSDTKQFGT